MSTITAQAGPAAPASISQGQEVARAITAEAVPSVGKETGLALPRFVSLKSGSVRMRVGPGTQYQIAWLYKRAGLPLEIIQEHATWRRVRDSQGETGWILHSLLTGRRTAIVSPWRVARATRSNSALLEAKGEPTADAGTTLRIQAGAVVKVRGCDSAWCAVEAKGHRAYLPQAELWGVYAKEKIEE